MSDLLENNNHAPVTRSADLNKFRRKCKYVPSKFKKSTKFVLPGVKNVSGEINSYVINNRKEPIIKKIDTEFDDNIFNENKEKVSFKGPKLVSTCTITIFQKESCHREFGYIQTSTLFSEGEFTNGILCSDFHSNLLHNQKEVLDSDLENYPFYSSDSYWKVPADKDPPNEIELELSDSPENEVKKMFDCSLKHNLGDLKQLERYQQFFVYLVMRSKQKNEEIWKYDVLYSFDWFIYLKWIRATDKTNNIYEYNYGINEDKEVGKFPELSEYYVCNDDQFFYWINREGCIFTIDDYPKSIYINKLERIYENIQEKISEAKDFNKKHGYPDAKKEVGEGNEFGLDGNNFRDKSDSIISKANEMFKSMKIINSVENEFSNRIAHLKMEEEQLCKLTSFDKHKIGSNLMRLVESTEILYSEIDKLIDNCYFVQLINELFKYFQCIDLRVDEIYNKINLLLPIVNNIINIIKYGIITDKLENLLDDIYELLPKINDLNKEIGEMYLEKYEFSKNFRFIVWEVNRLRNFIKYLDLEVNKIVNGIEFMDSEGRKQAIANSQMQFEKLFKDDNIDLVKQKFCKCNYLHKTELSKKLESAIINRNEHENKSLQFNIAQLS